MNGRETSETGVYDSPSVLTETYHGIAPVSIFRAKKAL